MKRYKLQEKERGELKRDEETWWKEGDGNGEQRRREERQGINRGVLGENKFEDTEMAKGKKKNRGSLTIGRKFGRESRGEGRERKGGVLGKSGK